MMWRGVDRAALPETRGESGPAAAALAYLGVLIVAEVASTQLDPRVGLSLDAITLLALLAHGALAEKQPRRGFLLVLSLVPLMRVLALALPLAGFPLLNWYVLVSIPLFLAAFLTSRTIGLPRLRIGLTVGRLPAQMAIALSGLLFGYAEYRILQPEPLTTSLALSAIWLPALILLICSGFLEELLFRGLLQWAAIETMGRFGILYVAVLFAMLHLGYQSASHLLLVFGVGLFFGWVVARTASLLGVTLAHGLTNILLFLVLPLAPLPVPETIALLPGRAPSATVTPMSAPTVSAAAVAIVTLEGLAIRSGPMTWDPMIATAHRGDRLAILERDDHGDWWKICCIAGREGWVSDEYIVTEGDVTRVAVNSDHPSPHLTPGQIQEDAVP